MSDLRLEWRTSEELADNPANWRRHPEKQLNALKDVIDEVGWAGAALYNEQTGRLIDGHARKEISNGDSIPVLIGSWTEEQERKILATLDPLAAMAETDQKRLDELIGGIETESDAIASMLEDMETQKLPEVEEVEVVDPAEELREKWGTEEGQLWSIGDHKLMIGDATKQNDVAKLLHGSVPYLMVTDPPYGVDYDPQWRVDVASLANTDGQRSGTVINDTSNDWSAAYAHFPGAVAYVWHDGRFASAIANHLESLSFEIRNQVIWNKAGRYPISRGHYHWQHEPCWYAVKKGHPANWCGDRKQTTVWDIEPTAGDTENLSHSTMKPVECMARPIRNHNGDVYDPFIGSGTTMVAAEQLGRRCFGMEIDPGYGAVCLERLAKLGLQPKLAK